MWEAELDDALLVWVNALTKMKTGKIPSLIDIHPSPPVGIIAVLIGLGIKDLRHWKR
jgi:hypothetical protein